MKWFDKWFAKKCKQAWYSVQPGLELSSANVKQVRRLDTPGLNFIVHKASGGYVIETSQYDRKTDRNNYNIHIITDDNDLGIEIGKIIVMESLRR